MSFCQAMGYTPVPASTDTIIRYVTMLARTLSYNSIKQYLNIVALLHKQHGLPNPIVGNFHLNNVLKGVRRSISIPPSRKLPITTSILTQILSKLDLMSHLDVVVWASAVTLFSAMLRRGNLLPRPDQLSTDKHLRRQDVTFHPWGTQLRIRYSKTIQFKQRELLIPLPRITDHVLCPTQALFLAFQRSSGASPSGPAMVYKSGSQYTPLSPDYFVKRIKQCLSLCGFDHTMYSGHSFRRGGATSAFQAGVPVETIKILGDWRSEAYQVYLTPSQENLSQSIYKTLVST